jgi:hypothetical protein
VNADAWFSLANTAVIPFWLLLALFPRNRFITHVLCPILVPAAYGVLYAACVFAGMGSGPGLDFSSLAALREVFASDVALLAGWVHYIAFDLFVGSWVVRDSVREELPHLAVVPVLFLVLMLGPLGMLCYLALRVFIQRRRGEL